MHVLIDDQTDDSAEQIWKDLFGLLPRDSKLSSPQQNDHSMISTEAHINARHQPDS
jgi:hypothetical protein